MHAHRIIKALEARGVPLLRFHKLWIVGAFAPGTQIAAASWPRGAAKAYLAANLAALAITPDSPLFEAGVEVLGVSASLEQSRVFLSFVRDALADAPGYRWLDSGQRLAVTHVKTGTKLRILSSSPKRAMGLAKFSTIFGDEPGSWEDRAGELMYHALRQSLGKRPGQRLVLIGTRAPSTPGSWWPELLDGGSMPGTFVAVMTAPEGEPWDQWKTIRKVNPMVLANPDLKTTILRERDEARIKPTMRPAFEAFRLNRQVSVHDDMLIAVDAWKAVESRSVPARIGKPVVAIDLGSERSWSAAWCLWENGRSECYAVCPGIPDLGAREKQDAMPAGLYTRLEKDGVLIVEDGRRTSDPETLINHLVSLGIRPATVYCDFFLLGRLRDAVAGRWPVFARRTRLSEATYDIAGFRRLVLDGPLSIVPEGRALARVSFSQAVVRSDDQGSARIVKRKNGRSRDDVAVCSTLASGALVRSMTRRPRRRLRSAIVG